MINLNKVEINIKKQPILREISCSIPVNSVFGIIGNNGAGKSTLLKVIATLLTPDKGTIHFSNIYSRKELQHKVSYFIESPKFDKNLTGYEYIYLSLSYKGVSDIKSKLDNYWPLDMEKYKHKKIKKYSQGMRQKLGIIASTMANSKIIILDEPHNSLDAKSIIQLRKYILSLANNGSTIIISSHSLDEVKQVCDTVLLIEEGHVKRRLEKNEFNNIESIIQEDVTNENII